MAKTEIIYGFQVLKEVLRHQPKTVQRLFLQENRVDDRVQELLKLAQASKLPVQWLNRHDLDKMLGTSQHQGMAIECSKIASLSESMLQGLLQEHESGPILLLILDGVQDPHNLGACIRTANAMGAAAVIAPKDRAAGLTEVVHKAACGATTVTPFIQITNLARTLRELKEHSIWLVGMDGEADQILSEINPGPRVALVMGSEGEGLRRLTRAECDFLVKIPMCGTVESLNVSVATAIGLYELIRVNRHSAA